MDIRKEYPEALAESGCRSGRPSAAASGRHGNLVIENLSEFAAAGAAGTCFCITDLVIRETRPAAA
jgi:hypothetical protein